MSTQSALTPKTGCDYYSDHIFKQTGCIMNAGILALIKFQGLGFETQIEEKWNNYQTWLKLSDTRYDNDSSLKSWLNIDHDSVNDKLFQKFRNRDKTAINANGNLLNMIRTTIQTNQGGLGVCEQSTRNKNNNDYKSLNIKTRDGYRDNVQFMRDMIIRFDIELIKEKDVQTYNFMDLIFDGNNSIDIGKKTTNAPVIEKDLDSSLFIIHTPRTAYPNNNPTDKWKKNKVIAPAIITPFKEENEMKQMKLVAVIAIADDTDESIKAIFGDNIDKAFSVFVLNPCQSTDTEEVWYQWNTDNTDKLIAPGKPVKGDIRTKLSRKGYVWLYAPKTKVDKLKNTNQPAQPAQPAQTTQVSNMTVPGTSLSKVPEQQQDAKFRQPDSTLGKEAMLLLPDSGTASSRNEIINELNKTDFKKSNRIRVMTYNIGPWEPSKFPSNASVIKKSIVQSYPDIVGIQEYNPSVGESQKLLEDLKRSGYTPHVTCTADNPLQNILLFNENSIDKLTKGNTISESNNLEADQRCYVMAEFALNNNPSVKFRVYNTHLSIEKGPRKTNIDTLIQRIASDGGSSNVIVMGDFNAYREGDLSDPTERAMLTQIKGKYGVDTYPIQKIEANGFVDTFAKHNNAPPPKNTTRHGGRVDYIYTSSGFELPLLGTYMRYQDGADHNPIIADFGVVTGGGTPSTPSNPPTPSSASTTTSPTPEMTTVTTHRDVYIPPVSREDMMRKIINNPPKSQGLGRKALVETIECQQLCQILDFAKTTNASPVVVIKPKSNSQGKTSRIYSITDKETSPIGTMVFIKQQSKIFGTFLKIRKTNEWIQLENTIDVDSDALQSIYVKGVGMFNIRGIVIPT